MVSDVPLVEESVLWTKNKYKKTIECLLIVEEGVWLNTNISNSVSGTKDRKRITLSQRFLVEQNESN